MAEYAHSLIDADPDRPPSEVVLEDVCAAADRLEGVAHRTPVMTNSHLDALTGAGRVYLKCENMQRVGAFKFRGAYNALSRLSDEAKKNGVLTFSSGNHAQAVALAGKLLGIYTVIVMPTDAPEIKKRATRGYQGEGGELVEYDRETISRESLGAELAAERGLTIVPPYDHPDVIAGQGTIALELLEEVGEIDRLYVCVGGGGQASGCGIVCKGLLGDRVEVIGVEPEAADDATWSFETRTLHSVHNPPTIADGARTPSLGRWTFPLLLRHVDRMMTVSDGELVEAMRLVMGRMKMVVEPTGVLALSGLLRDARERADEIAGQKIGVVVSGGNIDLGRLGELIGGSDG